MSSRSPSICLSAASDASFSYSDSDFLGSDYSEYSDSDYGDAEKDHSVEKSEIPSEKYIVANETTADEKNGGENGRSTQNSIDRRDEYAKRPRRSKKIPPLYYEILIASFAEDPTSPGRQTDRMDKLKEKTGRSAKYVQDWFWKRRVKIRTSREEMKKAETEATKKGFEILFSSFEADQGTPEDNSSRLAQLRRETGFTSRKIKEWFSTRQSAPVYKPHSKRTPKEKEILIAAYESDSSFPAKGSQRIVELCERIGTTPRSIEGWWRRHKEYLEERAQRMATEEGKKAVLEKEEKERQRKILHEFREKDASYPYKHSKRLKEMCEATGLPEAKVQKWFNSRANYHAERVNKRPADAQHNDKEVEIEETKKTIKHADDEALMVKRKEKTAEQREILLASYTEDSQVPSNSSARLEKLCAAAGLKPKAVQGFFHNKLKVAKRRNTEEGQRKAAKREEWEKIKGILIAAYEHDCTIPCDNGPRMAELCAATGLEAFRVRYLFHSYRRKNRAVLAGKIFGDEIEKDDRNCGSSQVKQEEFDEENLHDKNSWFDQAVKPEPDDSKRTSKRELVSPYSPNLPSNGAKKCPICDALCLETAIPIRSLNEAKKMDTLFGSSLVHFLSYTFTVRICLMHEEEYERVIAAQNLKSEAF